MTETTTTTGKRRILVGEVVGEKMNKTIVVAVARRIRHPQYGKVLTRRKKYYAHDENKQAVLGDIVRIIESRPISRLKHWQLVEIVEKSKSVEQVDV